MLSWMDIAFCLDINCGLYIWTKDSLLCDCFELFILSSAGLRFLDQSIDFARSPHRTVRKVCGKTQNTIRIHLSWEMDMRAAEAVRIKRNVKILEENLFNMDAVKRFINRIPEIKTLFKSRHS